jgi:hypothetical protein
METKNMSANPHSVVHARQFADVEKTKDEQPRKAEPGVKGVVSGSESKIGPCGSFRPVIVLIFALQLLAGCRMI